MIILSDSVFLGDREVFAFLLEGEALGVTGALFLTPRIGVLGDDACFGDRPLETGDEGGLSLGLEGLDAALVVVEPVTEAVLSVDVMVFSATRAASTALAVPATQT